MQFRRAGAFQEAKQETAVRRRSVPAHHRQTRRVGDLGGHPERAGVWAVSFRAGSDIDPTVIPKLSGKPVQVPCIGIA